MPRLTLNAVFPAAFSLEAFPLFSSAVKVVAIVGVVVERNASDDTTQGRVAAAQGWLWSDRGGYVPSTLSGVFYILTVSEKRPICSCSCLSTSPAMCKCAKEVLATQHWGAVHVSKGGIVFLSSHLRVLCVFRPLFPRSSARKNTDNRQNVAPATIVITYTKLR